VEPSFFVFGAERSGTTLLAFMLSGQPSALCLNDTFVFARLADAVTGAGHLNRAVTSLYGLAPTSASTIVRGGGVRALYHDARARRLGRSTRADTKLTADVIDRYLQSLAAQYRRKNDWYDFLTRYQEPLERASEAAKAMSSSTPVELVDLVLGQIAATVEPGRAIEVIGEKTPIHTLLAPWILDLFPEAHALLLVDRSDVRDRIPDPSPPDRAGDRSLRKIRSVDHNPGPTSPGPDPLVSITDRPTLRDPGSSGRVPWAQGLRRRGSDTALRQGAVYTGRNPRLQASSRVSGAKV
jgi:hypothetical protein